MSDMKKNQDNATKVASIVEKLDMPEQQRAVDIVTSFALGVQARKDKEEKSEEKLKTG